jgi:hypothetical protein
MKKEFPPKYDSFKYRDVIILPPSAFTDGRSWKRHIQDVATRLGPLYEELLELLGTEYYRYALLHITEESKIKELIKKLKTLEELLQE